MFKQFHCGIRSCDISIWKDPQGNHFWNWYFQSIYTHSSTSIKTMECCQFDTWKLNENVVDFDTLNNFT